MLQERVLQGPEEDVISNGREQGWPQREDRIQDDS